MILTAIFAKTRLDYKKASIIIPPHCGLELWDTINILDSGCNQSANYRVCSYTFECDVKQAAHRYHLSLATP